MEAVLNRDPGAGSEDVLEYHDEYRPHWAAIGSVAAKFGSTPETLRKWVRRAEVDESYNPGMTSGERSKVKDLERENRELKQAKVVALF